MVDWLERAVAVREISDSSPGRGGHKTFANVGNHLASSVSAGLSKDKLRTLNTHDTKPRKIQQHSLKTPYTLELDLDPFHQMSFISSRRTFSSIYCISEKRFPPSSYTWPPL